MNIVVRFCFKCGSQYNSGRFTIRNATVIDDPSLSGDLMGDALGGAIFIGQDGTSSPSIQIFENCSALGQYGSNGINAPAQGRKPGARGVVRRRHAWRRYILCNWFRSDDQSTPVYQLLCRWGCVSAETAQCRRVPMPLKRRSDIWWSGGDAGKGGCTGGAIYLSPRKPDLQQVVIPDCYIQVEAAAAATEPTAVRKRRRFAGVTEATAAWAV